MNFLTNHRYSAQDLDSSAFSNRAKLFWKTLSVFLIPVNIVIMLYMFKLIDIPGEPPVGNWQRGLWLSQYIGLFCCYLCLTEFKNPDLNGIYAYVFLFPHIAFFQSIGNIFTFLNHFPHFLGWYVLFNPKIKFSRRGIYWGFGYIMVWLLLCFLLQYPDGMGANANNISDELFPIILLGGLIWCGIVDRFWRRKQMQIAEIKQIPQEKWVTEWQSWMKFSKEIIPSVVFPKYLYYLFGTIIGGTLGYLIYTIYNLSSLDIWIQYFSFSWIFIILLLIGYFSGYKVRELNGILFGLLIPTTIDSIYSIYQNYIVGGLLVFSNLLIFVLYVINLKVQTKKMFSQFVNPIGIWIGTFLHGIVSLLTASFSYHHGWMGLNINFVQTFYPLVILIGNIVIWYFLYSRLNLPNTD